MTWWLAWRHRLEALLASGSDDSRRPVLVVAVGTAGLNAAPRARLRHHPAPRHLQRPALLLVDLRRW
jgi:hypothetical protein